MDKPVYTQEAMHNAIRQVVEEKRRLEEENKRLRDTVFYSGDFIGDKKPITQNCPTCEQLLAEVKRLEAELAEERRYWK